MSARLLRGLLIALLLTGGSALAECRAEIAPDGTMDAVLRRSILGAVWRTVAQNYLYDDFGGHDWDEQLLRFRVLVTDSETNAGFYRTVDNMILALGDEHSIYLAPWEVCEEDRLDATPPEIGADGVTAVPAPVATRIGPDGEIVLLELPSFDSLDIPDLVAKALDAALDGSAPAGLIVDLRRNYGGYLTSAYQVLSQFVSGEVGVEYDDFGDHPLDLPPGDFYFALAKVPVVVLVDRDTASAAEIVAAVLQQGERATIVGQSTLGNTETIAPFDYRDGSRLWLAVGGFRLRDGSPLEGRGVLPDVPVDPADSGDPALETAVGLLLGPRDLRP